MHAATSPIPIVVLVLLSFLAGQATGAPSKKVKAFVAAAAAKLPPGEALTALRAGPQEEYYRWGESVCKDLQAGKSAEELIEGNLDQFFGPELAGALVHAAKTVICP